LAWQNYAVSECSLAFDIIRCRYFVIGVDTLSTYTAEVTDCVFRFACVYVYV